MLMELKYFCLTVLLAIQAAHLLLVWMDGWELVVVNALDLSCSVDCHVQVEGAKICIAG